MFLRKLYVFGLFHHVGRSKVDYAVDCKVPEVVGWIGTVHTAIEC